MFANQFGIRTALLNCPVLCAGDSNLEVETLFVQSAYQEKWFQHVHRMEDYRFPNKLLKHHPSTWMSTEETIR
jgi:hypothetical protein